LREKAYLLQHSYEDDDGCEETKIIGIFSTEEKAKEVAQVYRTIEGFSRYPDCFFIDAYELDKQFWTEGFITIE